MRFKKLGVVARGGIEPPTRGFSVRRRARFGASKPKTGKRFLLADRTAPPDRSYPEPRSRKSTLRAEGTISFNGLGSTGPNFCRTAHRTGPRGPAHPRLDDGSAGWRTGPEQPVQATQQVGECEPNHGRYQGE